MTNETPSQTAARAIREFGQKFAGSKKQYSGYQIAEFAESAARYIEKQERDKE